MVWRPPEALEEGDHVIELAVPVGGVRRLGPSVVVHRGRHGADARGARTIDPVAIDAPVEVAGTVERGATLTADGDEIEVGDDGRFILSYDRPPAGPVTVEAVDGPATAPPRAWSCRWTIPRCGGARHRRGVERYPELRVGPPLDRRGTHRHGAARPEGRRGDRRLHFTGPAGAGDRGGDPSLRPRGRGGDADPTGTCAWWAASPRSGTRCWPTPPGPPARPARSLSRPAVSHTTRPASSPIRPARNGAPVQPGHRPRGRAAASTTSSGTTCACRAASPGRSWCPA